MTCKQQIHTNPKTITGKSAFRKIFLLKQWRLGAIQYHIRHLIVRFCKASNAWDCWLKFFQLLRNLASILAAVLQRCLPNFKAIRAFHHPILCLRDFAPSYEKKSNAILKRPPGDACMCISGVNYHQLKVCSAPSHYLTQCWLIAYRAPSQCKDRLIYIWRFPC